MPLPTRSSGTVDGKVGDISKQEKHCKAAKRADEAAHEAVRNLLPSYEDESTQSKQVDSTEAQDGAIDFHTQDKEEASGVQTPDDLIDVLANHNEKSNESYLVCPVCLLVLSPILGTTDLRYRWKNEQHIRAVRAHCSQSHPTEYLWNVCYTLDLERGSRQKSTVATVSGLINYAFRIAAVNVSLPAEGAFVHNWHYVRHLIFLRLAYACGVVNHSSQSYTTKKTGCQFPKRVGGGTEEQFKMLRSEALLYVKALMEKVMHSRVPDKFENQVNEPRSWKEYPASRKRNLIELFFWDGRGHRDLELISDLPPTDHF